MKIRTFTCENGKYFKSIIDNSVILCDEIINVTDIVSLKVTNTISTNVTGTVSTNSGNRKLRYKNLLLYFP